MKTPTKRAALQAVPDDPPTLLAGTRPARAADFGPSDLERQDFVARLRLRLSRDARLRDRLQPALDAVLAGTEPVPDTWYDPDRDSETIVEIQRRIEARDRLVDLDLQAAGAAPRNAPKDASGATRAGATGSTGSTGSAGTAGNTGRARVRATEPAPNGKAVRPTEPDPEPERRATRSRAGVPHLGLDEAPTTPREWVRCAWQQATKQAPAARAKWEHAPHMGVLACFVRVLKASPDLQDGNRWADAATAWEYATSASPLWADELGVMGDDEDVGFTDEDALRIAFRRLWLRTERAAFDRPFEKAHRYAAAQPIDLSEAWPDAGERETALVSAAGWLQLDAGIGAPIWLATRTWQGRLKCRRQTISDILASARARDLMRTNGRGGYGKIEGVRRLAPEYLFAVHRVGTLCECLEADDIIAFRLAFEALPKSAEAIAAEAASTSRNRKSLLPPLSVLKARSASNVTSMRTGTKRGA